MNLSKIVEDIATIDVGEISPDHIVKVLNDHMAAVMEGGICWVLDKHPGGEGVSYRLLRDGEVEKLFKPFQVSVTMGRRVATWSYFKVWFEHPDRETYAGGLMIDPARKPGAQGPCWNVWPGLSFPEVVKDSPRPRGSWRRLRHHLRFNWCHTEAEWEFLLKTMARLIQFPELKADIVVIAYTQEEGTGKDTPMEHLSKLLPAAYVAEPQGEADITGDFNKTSAVAIMTIGSEIFFARDKRSMDRFKAQVTQSFVTVGEKYEPKLKIVNRSHYWLTSNRPHVVEASATSRRWFVMRISTVVMQAHEFFAAMKTELQHGDDSGYKAMKWDLLNIDLTHFNHRAIPETDGLRRQRAAGLSQQDQWWASLLETGAIPGTGGGWQATVAGTTLYDSYREFCGRAHHSRREPEIVNIFSRDYLVETLKLIPTQTRRTDLLPQGVTRGRVYDLRPLADMRQEFDARCRTGLWAATDDGVAEAAADSAGHSHALTSQ